jgi:hypothetical protein
MPHGGEDSNAVVQSLTHSPRRSRSGSASHDRGRVDRHTSDPHRSGRTTRVSFLLWSGQAIGHRRAGVGIVVGVACAAAAVTLFPDRPFDQPKTLAGAAFLAVAAVTALVWAAAMGHVGVQISMYNVRIRHGLLPMPPITVPLRMVNSMRAVDVQSSFAQRWGWTWVPGRGRAVIVRSGPALLFDFAGRQFTVSVDDPDEAEAALNRMRSSAR